MHPSSMVGQIFASLLYCLSGHGNEMVKAERSIESEWLEKTHLANASLGLYSRDRHKEQIPFL